MDELECSSVVKFSCLEYGCVRTGKRQYRGFSGDLFLHFHTVHGVPKARILKWFAIPFTLGLQGSHTSQS